MKVGAALLALSVTVSLACSPANVGAPGVDGGNDGGTLQAVCAAYAYAYCGRVKTCSTAAIELRYGDQRTCESLFTAICLNYSNAPSTGQTPAIWQACASVLGGTDWACTDFLNSQNSPPACDVAPGGLPTGAACGVRAQCASDFCALPTNGACGTCQPLPGPGSSCASTLCPIGLTCFGAPPTCLAIPQQGQACALNQFCIDGLTCVGATATAPGTCQQGATGGACSPTGAGCDLYYSGLACNAGTGMCATAKLALPGEACGDVADQLVPCQEGSCTRGVCVGDLQAGDPCELGGPPCVFNTRCIVSADGGTSGTCQVNGSVVCP